MAKSRPRLSRPTDPALLCVAVNRAVRALAVSFAGLVGLRLPPDYSKASVQSDAARKKRVGLDILGQPEFD